jgi:SnoaL-like polyketide cyclase
MRIWKRMMTVNPERLAEFARRYTEAWCSQDPARVAEHYEPRGSLTINGGAPSVGRAAITEAARSFMTAFPDMQVLMDDLVVNDEAIEYHWRLVGTHTGPGGTGNRVRISGFEEWTISAEGLVAESRGHYDQGEYDRQLAIGVSE